MAPVGTSTDEEAVALRLDPDHRVYDATRISYAGRGRIVEVTVACDFA